MDPITLAIVAALTAGATSGLSETAKAMIAEAYQGLKNVIKKKVTEKSPLITSIEVLETKPQSVGRQQTLNEEIMEAQIDQDQDILAAAHKLMTLVQPQQVGLGKFTIQNTGTVQGQVIGDHAQVKQHFGNDHEG